MSSKLCDRCIVCSKVIRNCHKNICCKKCNGYIHKKCTKLKQKQLKCLDVKDWICKKCSLDQDASCSDLDTSLNNLNENPFFNVIETDFDKYDSMVFSPLSFDHNSSNKVYNDISNNENLHQCSYIIPDQFRHVKTNDQINLLKLMYEACRKISSLSKNVLDH